jgi:hypothetical protein
MVYRLSWGDLEGVEAAPYQHSNSVRLAAGSQLILDKCLAGVGGWQKDPLIFRLAHLHAASSISCRENASPGMHVIFYLKPDGSREAWAHFDLFGAGNRFAHSGEVVQNELTFGSTSQVEVYRGLVKRHEDTVPNMPASDYDYAQSLREYAKAVFAPSLFLDSIADASSGPEPYNSRVEGGLARNGLQQSIEFGTGALLRQDETYLTSRDESTGRRIQSAIYHSFVVQGRNGEELAFPRIAAAFCTAWAEQEWHPWRRSPPDPMKEASIILSSYVARSVWQEFKPDLRAGLKHFIH